MYVCMYVCMYFESSTTPFLRISYNAEDVVLSEAFRNLSTLLFCERYRCLYLHLNNIQHFHFQLTHTTLKNVELLTNF